MADIAYIRCPQCNTVIEKPASGTPVCPNCGFGAPPAKPTKAAKTAGKTAGKTASRTAAATPPPPPPAPVPAPAPAPAAWASAATAPPSPMSPPPTDGMPPRTSAKATTALVLGIVACCIGFVPFIGAFLALPMGIAALVLGILGVKECDRDPAMVKGKGLAVTGIVLGSIMIVIGILLLILVTVGFAALEDAVCEEDPDSEACQSLRERSGMAPPSKAFAADARPWWTAALAPTPGRPASA